ncbi:MAG TPA: hypothetical protein VFX96_01425 [Pyrinomonadaceae bacterium]|nr:hypothetical protein [Pyrinomonadaceae bacterium]
MQHSPSRIHRGLELAALALVVFFFAAPSSRAQQTQTQPSVVGVWQAHVAGLPIIVRLNADGTGEFDEEPLKYTVRGATIVVEDEDGVTTYGFTLRGDTLTVSGGDLGGSLVFTRVGAGGSSAKGEDARKEETDRRAEAGVARGGESGGARENPLVGRWQSREATVVISDDGTLTLNGTRYSYSVRDGVITLSSSEGSMSFPFELSGDTLNVQVNGEKMVYRRADGAGAGEAVGAAGVPEELVGKWCYMSNVNSQSGGRMSNRCITLYADGTYEYYAETSSSGPVASSASQESDTGRWTATATTITSTSSTKGTNTYRLEKRNHPKNGDPMLVLDGDAYVTATQRAPWPE